ncbi:acylphosphatase [Rhizobium leucaenae]|uniref:Acylphosphatase n=1 Tax=Rhizobium leucaenae TaxID=29450 RepID=A0A7W6ZSM3_9HYPH|nr:acylphosphatase [Rhizobium leucaenae]MBB4568043.1 acylphosphatase [Rhizobium leucaenae]MBB6301308.1 acylphosphatase [Rhizobium leucaenae]
MADDYEAALVRITGRVQGVSFRVWTRNEASRLGLAGWVRNEADGSVLALIAGPNTAISTMIERFWHGPPGASVSSVEKKPAALTQTPTRFRITG